MSDYNLQNIHADTNLTWKMYNRKGMTDLSHITSLHVTVHKLTLPHKESSYCDGL